VGEWGRSDLVRTVPAEALGWLLYLPNAEEEERMVEGTTKVSEFRVGS